MVPAMVARATGIDVAGAFPADDIAALRACGVLTAPLPVALGGFGAGTEPGGAGLGLSIVQSICSAHGVAVEVLSAPAQGTSFRVRLPLAGD